MVPIHFHTGTVPQEVRSLPAGGHLRTIDSPVAAEPAFWRTFRSRVPVGLGVIEPGSAKTGMRTEETVSVPAVTVPGKNSDNEHKNKCSHLTLAFSGARSAFAATKYQIALVPTANRLPRRTITTTAIAVEITPIRIPLTNVVSSTKA